MNATALAQLRKTQFRDLQARANDPLSTYAGGIIVFNLAQQRETVLALIEAYRAYRRAAIKAGMWATRRRPPAITRTRIKYKRTGRVDD